MGEASKSDNKNSDIRQAVSFANFLDTATLLTIMLTSAKVTENLLTRKEAYSVEVVTKIAGEVMRLQETG